MMESVDLNDPNEDFEATNAPQAPLTGTILEAAFVDPAYSWPPQDGEGRNAIELQAATNLLKSVDPASKSVDGSDDDDDDEDLVDPEPPKIKRKTKVVTTTETTTSSRCGFFRCCKSEDAVVETHMEKEPIDEEEKERLKQEYLAKKAEIAEKRKEKAKRKKLKKARRKDKYDRERYNNVPEGILIYRLDTALHTISLMSRPNSNTNMDTLVEEMIVAHAAPSRDKSRRGIQLRSIDGIKTTLVACEQRTAIAWMEALEMMMGNRGAGRRDMGKTNVDPKKVSDAIVCVSVFLSSCSLFSQK